jgi:chemotaxis protein MotA
LDLATLIGLVGALGIVVSSVVLGASPLIFFNVPSILIVVGGSLFVVLSKFSVQQFLGAFKVAAKAFKFKLPSTETLIDEIMEVARIARKDGFLALDNRESAVPFFKMGIQLMVDGQPPEVVRAILEKERLLTLERHRWGAKVFTAMGDVGPAMGMIGTLIGLVQMLSNMEDPKSIGPAMAVALLTTLYGAMMATMIFLPMADKLNLRMTEEARMNAMLIDAVTAIQNGTNPRVVEQLVTSYLPPKKRKADEA